MGNPLSEKTHAQVEFAIPHIKNRAEALEKYLFLTNAGGAVATLAFMGSSGLSHHGALLPLGIFIVGILLLR